MMKLNVAAASTLCVASTLTAGCAGMPEKETVRYALPRAVTQITITQTLGCPTDTTKAQTILSAISVSPTTTYTADPKSGLIPIGLGDFDKHLSDPDVDINLTSDGRLKSINTTMTGEGATAVKTAISVASLAAAATGFGFDGTAAPSPGIVCKKIAEAASAAAKASGGTDKPTANLVTLTYTATLKYTLDGTGVLSPGFDDTQQPLPAIPALNPCPSNKQPTVIASNALASQVPNGGVPPALATTTGAYLFIPPDANTAGLFKKYDGIRKAAGTFCLSIVEGAEKPTSAEWTGDSASPPSGYTPLTLARIASITLAIAGPKSFVGDLGEVWRGTVTVPIGARQYKILMPNGSTFGTQKFMLQLAEDGSITELHYGASGGASDVGSAAQSIYQALPTNESKANDLSAQSDLIYEQQRLMTCQLTPAKCVAK